MRTSLLFAGLIVAQLCGSARAASVMFELTDQDGHPVANAVVALSSSTQASPEPASSQQIIIDQRNETFIPLVSILGHGGAVIFRNSDRVRHHVYSFSPLKQFQLVLNPNESSQPVKFDKTGVVAIGCNIHDRMVTYVYVTDTKWTALTHNDGSGIMPSVPKGDYKVTVWHPQLKPGAAPVTQTVSVGTQPHSIPLTVSIIAATPMHGHHGSGY
jgi:plastocyanin